MGTVTFEFMRSIQFLPSYGSVSHGHPPTQQCDIGHSASFCLCLTERLRPLSSWDLYNLIFKRCGQRPILVFLVNPLCTGGGPKDPQLSKSLNALKWVHKNCRNVFDFFYIELKKISIQKFCLQK